MSSIKFDTIRAIIRINGKEFPLFSGFLSAEMISKIARVPNFSKDKQHYRIAVDVSNPPIDEWQRPLESEKANRIKEIYSDAQKQNLMANPVLLGGVPHIESQDAKVEAKQKVVTINGIEQLPLENIFEITVTYSESNRPLWILDGQHRIEGMKHSTQKSQPIPFVLLYHDSVYTGPFLAEIFTHVTTGATPMEPLHGEWMKYSFDLDQYGDSSYKKSMQTVIELCKETTFDGQTNPFNNKIQFNPYMSSEGYYAFSFDAIEWTRIIAESYYGSGGSLEPKELAGEIVKSIRTFEDLDKFKNNGSKFFSRENTHKILAEAFLCALLKNISQTTTKRTMPEWNSFYINEKRQFDKCDWRLTFVTSGEGALSSRNGTISKKIAIDCFDLAFNDPDALDNNKLTDYLQGVGAKFKITALQKSASGSISSRNQQSIDVSPGKGLTPFDVNKDSLKRDIIRIEAITSNCVVLGVFDIRLQPPERLQEATMRKGVDITTFEHGKKIGVETMSYSGDTRQLTQIRLDKSELK